MASYS